MVLTVSWFLTTIQLHISITKSIPWSFNLKCSFPPPSVFSLQQTCPDQVYVGPDSNPTISEPIWKCFKNMHLTQWNNSCSLINLTRLILKCWNVVLYLSKILTKLRQTVCFFPNGEKEKHLFVPEKLILNWDCIKKFSKLSCKISAFCIS